MNRPIIRGLLGEPKRTARGDIYRGRFTCHDVQWTGKEKSLFCSFAITAAEIADAAASNLLWTDQDVQRGIRPEISAPVEKELSLEGGYPNPRIYIFDSENADDIVDKLLSNSQLFLNPLVWNLRPGYFEAFPNFDLRELYLYSGQIFLPDSHHRHQAIVKAVKIWRDAPREYPEFTESQQFQVVLYFLDKEDEGNYFFDKNQRPRPTAKSKAYDLTTQDDLSLLAKKFIDQSRHLQRNVNRVTDRLASNNPQVITLSTLREMMKTFAALDHIDSAELDGLAAVAAEFYDMLADVRPELSHQDSATRRAIRGEMVVDSAVMMHGYAHLMRAFNQDMAKLGTSLARDTWRARLSRLAKEEIYQMREWRGDIFDKQNPLWSAIGVTRSGNDGGRVTVLNTGAARLEAGRALRQLLLLEEQPTNLSFLVG
jgi:hypothetical protein